MPGLSRDLDPGAAATRLARSASSTGPAASKQSPPRTPRSPRRQPTIVEEPGELAGVSHADPLPCAASPPRALARPTPPIAEEEAVKKAAETLKAPSPCPAPSSRPTFGSSCPPLYGTTPSYYSPAAARVPPWTSSLFPRPYVPASAMVLPTKGAMQPHTAVGVSATRTQRPTPYSREGIQAGAGFNNKKGDGQLYSSKEQHPFRIRDREQSLSLPMVEATLEQTQRPMPYPKEGVQVGFEKKGKDQLHSSKECALQIRDDRKQSLSLPMVEVAVARTQRPMAYPMEDQLHSNKERVLQIREQRVANLGQPLTGCMSNPMEQDILESIATFGSKNTKEMDIIRKVLMILPEGPRSMLRCEQCSSGDVVGCADRGAIRDNGDASATAFKEPLILYDTDIVEAAKAIGARMNFAHRITDILHKHSGPVRYFRVDSFQLENGTEQLQEWFELLTRKQVKEVVFVNCRWPMDMFDFPINNLDCESIESIRLCFVKISDICLNYVKNLSTINLSCCSISTQDLYALSYQCKHLKELNIGLYEGDTIRINSENLEVLIVWNCTVRKVAVQNAVKLQRVSVTALPRKPALHVGIWIEDAQVLTYACFNLSLQSVSICNLRNKTDNAPMPNLRRLVLHFSFKVEKEKEVLMNLMKSSMTLKELILWRNDEAYRFECLDALVDDWSAKFKALPCLKLHLEVFMIKDYKGGDIEIAISSAILEHASHLKQLILQADASQGDTIFACGNTNFEKIVRASTNVVVKCEIGLSDV